MEHLGTQSFALTKIVQGKGCMCSTALPKVLSWDLAYRTQWRASGSGSTDNGTI